MGKEIYLPQTTIRVTVRDGQVTTWDEMLFKPTALTKLTGFNIRIKDK